ncbi:MAG: hypothetical protein H0X30_25085 [Anaerolineae bacterium]|nr:hypothetical protein [Anaerolineae bacterium]
MLYLKADQHIVSIEDEPALRHQYMGIYQKRYILGDYPVSAHGVKYGSPEVVHSCLLVASGGGTTVHSKSALIHNEHCIVAVSSFLACLHLPDLNMVWQAQVDHATCFGVYHLPQLESYLTHGELDIARVSYDGEIIWSSGGKDIFSNGFTLYDTFVEAIDFNNEKYHIDLSTGQSHIIQD